MESKYEHSPLDLSENKKKKDSIARWVVYSATLALAVSLIVPSVAFPGMIVALVLFGNIYWSQAQSVPALLTILVMLVPTAIFYGFIGYIIGRARNK